jgi:signal recognition particle subunit SRP19
MAKVKKTTRLRSGDLVSRRLDGRQVAVKKRKGAIMVWPAYLDSKLSRAQGRRVPVNLAAPDVTIDILEEAATAAGLESEVQTDKRYPRNWSGIGGGVVLHNPEGHKKKRLLLMLAKGVRRIVAQREAARQAAETKKAGKKRRK